MIEFAQPLALWTGLTLTLPIFAHLAYQKIREKFGFSTLRFLEVSTVPRSGKRQPSDWLLLLLRMLLFLLISMLLADPYWRDLQADPILPSTRVEKVFLVDTSPSMGGWEAWEQVADSVLDRMEEDPLAQHALLFPQKDSIRECPLGSSPESILQTLQSAQLMPSAHGLQAMVDRSLDLFSPGAEARKVIFLSDFQKSSWQEIESSFAQMNIEVELVPLGHGDQPWNQRSGNRAVVESRVAPAGAGNIRVWSVLKNWDRNRSLARVSLLAGGQTREVTEVSLPPEGSAQVQFILPSEDFSHAVICLEDEDSYPLDNNQSLWLLPPPPRTFGFWSSSQEDTSLSLEEKFLQTAMESAGDGEWDSWEHAQSLADELRLGSASSALDFLIIPGLSGWFEEEGLAAELEQYLGQGGTALITPSGDSLIQLNQALKDSRLLNASFGRLNQPQTSFDPYRVDHLSEKSFLSDVFFGQAARDLYLTQVLQFCTTIEGEGVKVPLRERSGKPLFLIRSLPDGGRLVFSTFRMIPQWTDLPMRNSFLPLLVELCGLNQSDELTGNSIRLQSGENRELSSAVFSAWQPGLFQVDGRRIEVVHPFAESIPELIDKAELIDALSGGSASGSGDVLDSFSPDHPAHTPLWHWFALGVALLFFLEMIFSSPRGVPETTQGVTGA